MRYLILFFCYLIPEITGRKPEIPSQIHLSYHNARTRSISWVTFEKSPVSFNICKNWWILNFFKQYLFLKERNVGRLKRSLVFRSNEKVFEGDFVFDFIKFMLMCYFSFNRVVCWTWDEFGWKRFLFFVSSNCTNITIYSQCNISSDYWRIFVYGRKSRCCFGKTRIRSFWRSGSKYISSRRPRYVSFLKTHPTLFDWLLSAIQLESFRKLNF